MKFLRYQFYFHAKMKLFEIYQLLVSVLRCLKHTAKNAIPKKSRGIDVTPNLVEKYHYVTHSLEAEE